MAIWERLAATILFWTAVIGASPAAAEDVAAPIPVYALLVGVNEYAEPSDAAYKVTNLKGTANDVTLIRDLLVSNYGAVDDQEHIQALLDKSATHAAIAETFQKHLIDKAKANPNGTFVFYFSGHGSLAEDKDDDE